jgi:hypothetical protein
MKNLFRKKILYVVFLFPIILAGCKLPFYDKEITIPFFEKEPRETIMLSYEKMGKVKSFKQTSEGQMTTKADLAIFSEQPLYVLFENRRRILGIKEYSASGTPEIASGTPDILPDSTASNTSEMIQDALVGENSLEKQDDSHSTTSESVSGTPELIKDSLASGTPEEGQDESASGTPEVMEDSINNQASNALNSKIPKSLDAKISFKQSGSFSRNADNSFDSQNNIEATFGMLNVDVKVSLETIKKGTSTYLKIGDLPFISSFLGNTDLMNNWIYMDGFSGTDLDSLKSFTPLVNKASSTKSLDPKTIEDKLLRIKESVKTEIMKEEYSTINRLPDEEISGHKDYHYVITTDSQKLAALFKNIAKIYYDEFSDSAFGSGSIQDFEAKADKLAQGFQKIQFETYIDKKTFYLDKISGAMTVDLAPAIGEFPAKSASFSLNYQSVYSDFESNITIEPPKDYKIFSKILADSVFGMFASKKTSDTNMSDTKASAESIVEEIPKNPGIVNASNLLQIQTALELYHIEKNEYPKSLVEGESIIGNRVYLEMIPKSMNYGSVPYDYTITENGKSYLLKYAIYENDDYLGKAGIVYCMVRNLTMIDCPDYQPSAYDLDGDQVVDQAEKEIYKTDPIKADTDGDGYSDGSELKKGYNPNGDGKLPEIINETASSSIN